MYSEKSFSLTCIVYFVLQNFVSEVRFCLSIPESIGKYKNEGNHGETGVFGYILRAENPENPS